MWRELKAHDAAPSSTAPPAKRQRAAAPQGGGCHDGGPSLERSYSFVGRGAGSVSLAYASISTGDFKCCARVGWLTREGGRKPEGHGKA